jgi:hypothetical protein
MSVKFAYWMIRSTKVHDRLKIHMWREAADILLTKSNLSKILNQLDIRYPPCSNEQETTLHIFQQCEVAKAVWFGSAWGLRINNLQVNHPKQLIEFFINPPKDQMPGIEQKDKFTL